MTQAEYNDLWDGALVQYGFFKNVMFTGETKDGKHVVMKDKHGNEKNVYTSLFLQHALVLNRTC